MFSRRSDWGTEPNALQQALEAHRRAGHPVIDLAISNPSAVGLRYPDAFYARLVDARSAVYEPAPLGLDGARAAVAGYYRERGCACALEQVWLCASTSEAYANLLALLCDPGDAVLVPRPGYPLLDFIADLAGVRLAPYALAYDGRWHVDRASLGQALAREPRARALVCIAPGNPTGHYLSRDELGLVGSLCAEREMALIVDQVFADYPLRDDLERVEHGVGSLDRARCLAFVLSGLSKVALLAQLKLAWGVACGPRDLVARALERLSFVTDTFLSAATPVQLALPAILEAAPGLQARLRERLRANLAALRSRVRGSPLDALDVEGGWSAILRLPALPDWSDERMALRLLERAHVWAQPGALFDLDGGHLVVSLLCDPATFEEAIEHVVREVSLLAEG